MSIPSIINTGRVAAPVADKAAPAPAAPHEASAARPFGEPEIDAVTQQPLPPRFPWLSRLTRELGPASKQAPAFEPAPPLGDHIDRSA